MSLANAVVFDLEANGLNPDKIWCLSMSGFESTDEYDKMKEQLASCDFLVGHNIVLYDIPVLERLLGIKIKAKLVDTLALSWYLYPNRIRHGLEWWGEEFGVPKPEIDNWDELPVEEYMHRCDEDVKINEKLWKKQLLFLTRLYEGDERQVRRLIAYLTFKMQCVRLQEESRWKVNVGKVETLLKTLKKESEEKTEALRLSMPKVAVYTTRNPPKKPYKLNGELSASGAKWQALLDEEGLPEGHKEPVKFVSSYVEPNPGSHVQVKDWLDSLGWVPETFEYKRDKETGDVRKIPQVSLKDGKGLCRSIKKLFKKEPALEEMNGLSLVNHRISVLEGFLNNNVDGWLKARVGGLTNTLRFKHRELVNLPGVGRLHGEAIRGVLEAEEGWVLCGSDMASLEDRCKQHYMWPHDPEYVKEMMRPGFDPHLDLALLAKAITEAQVEEHKSGAKSYQHIRDPFKATNYAAVYGSGAPTLSRTAGVGVREAEKLLKTYWERNWSVRKIAEDCVVKQCGGQKWLYNPVSRFWYSLRHEKDRFSTLNQGTGVYCFDTWVKHVLSKRKQLTAQFHDEIVLCIREGFEEKCEGLLKWAINKTNEELKLNVKLDVSVDFGENYSQIH